jgi:hypothetical protein
MKEKGEVESSDSPEYHEKSLRIMSLMQHPGWTDFWGEIEKTRKMLQERSFWTESDIEVASVNNSTKGITVVMLNKDVVKMELQVWKRLENTIEKWKKEAMKRPEAENGNANERE